MSINFLQLSLTNNHTNTSPSCRNTPHTDLVKYGVDPGQVKSNPSPNNSHLVSELTNIDSAKLKIQFISLIHIYRIKENKEYEILVNKKNGEILSNEKKGFEDILRFDSLLEISKDREYIDNTSYWTSNKYIKAKK